MDMTARLWRVSDGLLLRTLREHTGDVWDGAFSQDGRTLATGSVDQTIGLWSVSNGRQFATLSGHTGRVLAVAFSVDGKVLVSGSDDRSIRFGV